MVATPAELARLIGAAQIPNTSLSTFGPNPLLQQQGRPQPSAPQQLSPLMAAQLEAAKTRVGVRQPKGPDEPWYKDVGNALGTTLGVAAKPLSFLQKPQRAIVATLEGWAENDQGLMGSLTRSFIDEQRTAKDNRSFGDKVADDRYGFGSVAESTGTKWGDRLVGFAGDVATDPTTYLTFGATSAAGKAARAGLAAKAATLSDDAIRKLGTSVDDLVVRTGKGAAWLNDAERALLGVEKSGVRFAGARIPGTGGVARTVGKATGTVRRNVMRPWHHVRLTSTPEHLQWAQKVLNTGKAIDGMTPRQAGAVMAVHRERQLAANIVARPAAEMAQQTLAKMDEATRRAATHELESGNPGPLRDVLDWLHTQARESGVQVGRIEGAADGGVDFMPHVWDDKARKFMDGATVERGGKRTKVDLSKESGRTLERQLRGGEYTINGVSVDFGRGSIREINEAMSKAFPESGITKWLEDDAAKLLDVYIAGISADIGVVQGFKKLLDAGGDDLAKTLDSVADEVLDKVATRSANGEMRKALEKAKALRAEGYKAEQAVARQQAADLQREVMRVASSRVQMHGEIGKRLKALIDAGLDEGKTLDELAETIGKGVASRRAAAEKELERLSAQAAKLDESIAAAKLEVAAVGEDPRRLQSLVDRQKRFLELETQINTQRQLIAEAEVAAAQAAEYAQIAASIRASMDDPDAMQALAQELVPKLTSTEYRSVGVMEDGRTLADVKVEEYTKKLEELDTMLSDEARMDAVVDAADVADAQSQAFQAARNARKALEGDLQEAAQAVNAARARRVGAEPIATPPGAQPTRDVFAAERRLREATSNRKRLEEMSRAADGTPESDEIVAQLLDARAVERRMSDALEEARRRTSVSPSFPTSREKLAKGAGAKFAAEDEAAVAAAQAEAERATEEYLKAIGVQKEGLEKLVLRGAEDRRVALNAPDQVRELTGQWNENVAAQEATKSRRAAAKRGLELVDTAGASRTPAQRTAMRLTLAEQARDASNEMAVLLRQGQLIANKLKAAREQLFDVQARVGTSTKVAQQAQAEIDNLERLAAEVSQRIQVQMPALPKAEQRYWETLQKLNAAHVAERDAAAAVRNAEAALRRAARLDSVEARRSAAAEMRRYWERQRFAGGSQGGRRIVQPVQVERPAFQLAPKSELQARLDALPSTSVADLRGGASSAARTKVDVAPSAVSDDMLAVLPEQEALAFRALRDEYDQLRAAGIPAEGGRGVQAQLDELGARLDEQAQFIARFNEAVAKGAPRNDQTATAVARAVVSDRAEVLSKRAKSLRAAGQGSEEELKNAFFEELNAATVRGQELADRLRKAYAELRKYGGSQRGAVDGFGAKVDRGVAHAPAEAIEDMDAIAGRLELGDLIRQTKDELKSELELTELSLRTALGEFGNNSSSWAARQDLLARAEGDFDIAWQMADDTTKGVSAVENTIDKFTARGRSLEARGAYYRDVFKPWFDELYAGLSPEAKARLQARVKDEVGAVEAQLREAGAARQRLGLRKRGAKASDVKVSVDWRQVMFGTGERGTLDSVAADLQGQLGLYNTVESAASASVKAAEGAAKASTAASDAAAKQAGSMGMPSSVLDGLPSPQEASFATVNDARKAMADVVAAREEVRAQTADALDAVRDDPGYKNLEKVSAWKAASDTFVKQTQESFDQTQAALKAMEDAQKRAAKLSPDKGDVDKVFTELSSIVKAMEDGSWEMEPVLALHRAYAEQIGKLRAMDASDAYMGELSKLAKAGSKKGGEAKGATAVYKAVIADGWAQVADQLLSPRDALVVQEPIARAFANVDKALEKGEIWKAVEKATQFFKTYATATPGFHVRNALSGVFMNFSDGVSFDAHGKAFSAWSKYIKDPIGYLDRLKVEDPKMFDAFRAVFGSGGGGQFSAEEFAAETSSRILHNWWTKKSRQIGGNVEGPMRLAMAFDTIANGGDTLKALDRVTRIHFNYGELSNMDRRMKLMVPFWTFMSRNLPLQIQQMWMRPRMYSMWNHFVTNMGGPEGFIPQWMQPRGPIGLGGDSEGNQWALTPDLPHLGMGEDMATFDMRDPMRVLSNMNPMFVAPMEAVANQRFRFGSEIGDMGDRTEHLALQMLPPLAQAQRLLGMGRYEGQADEKILNFLGVPVQKITPEEQANEARRQRRDGKP